MLIGLPKREQSRYRSYLLSCRERYGSRRKGMDLPHSGIRMENDKPISLPTLGKQLVRESDRGVVKGKCIIHISICNADIKRKILHPHNPPLTRLILPPHPN